MCELPPIKIGGFFCHHCHKEPVVPGILEHTIPTILTADTGRIKIERCRVEVGTTHPERHIARFI